MMKSGAVDFAQQLTEGLSREESAVFISELLALDDVALSARFGPRVKHCIVCGYPFMDKTKPSNATVCGDGCRTTKKSRQKAVQRGRMTKGERKPVTYVWWLEYPFYTPHEAMMRRAYSYEKPFGPDKLFQIIAAKERKERMGGRKRPVCRVEY